MGFAWLSRNGKIKFDGAGFTEETVLNPLKENITQVPTPDKDKSFALSCLSEDQFERIEQFLPENVDATSVNYKTSQFTDTEISALVLKLNAAKVERDIGLERIKHSLLRHEKYTSPEMLSTSYIESVLRAKRTTAPLEARQHKAADTERPSTNSPAVVIELDLAQIAQQQEELVQGMAVQQEQNLEIQQEQRVEESVYVDLSGALAFSHIRDYFKQKQFYSTIHWLFGYKQAVTTEAKGDHDTSNISITVSKTAQDMLASLGDYTKAKGPIDLAQLPLGFFIEEDIS